MLKVLMIDDEPWTLKGMESIIAWQDYGFEICGMAGEGITGLKMIEKLHPDVVLLDISMPQMSGLEVLKRIQQMDQEISVIILSGYAEFAYAQKALKMGARDYLLKPADEDELIQALKSIKKHKESGEDTGYIQQITRKRITPDPEILRAIVYQRLDIRTEEPVTLLYANTAAPDRVPQELKQRCFFVPLSAMELLIFARTSQFDSDKALGESMAAVLGQPVGVSRSFVDFREFYKKYTQVRSMVSPFWNSQTPVNLEPGHEQDIYVQMVKKLWKSLGETPLTAFVQLVGPAVDRIMASDATALDRIFIYNNLYAMLCSCDDGCRSKLGSISLENIVNHQYTMDFDQMVQLLQQLFCAAAAAQSVSVGDDRRLADRVCMYIDDHFTQPNLTVRELAAIFYTNTAYLGQAFKKCHGITVSEYITKKRMDYAQLLMKDRALSIEQIADMTGISDYFYFNKLYKKYKGITPGKARKLE